MSSQYNVAQIQQQNQVFQQALAQHKISQTQYNQAMQVQNANLVAAESPKTFSPVPPEPGTQKAIVQQTQSGDIWLSSNYHVASKTTTPTATGTVTNYTFAPNTSAAATQQSTSPKSPSPLQQGVLGHSPNIFGAVNTVTGKQNIINTPQKAVFALEVLSAAVVAPAIGVGATILGAGANVAVSQGLRFVPSNPVTGQYQGTFGTPTQIIEQAAQGVIFAGAGKAILGAGETVAKVGLKQAVLEGFESKAVMQTSPSIISGVAARAVWTAPGRVAVFTGMGATIGGGAEYVSTGKVTAQGVGTGALFGLAFSAGGEVAKNVNAKYDVTGKVSQASDTVKNDIVYKNQAVLERLQNIDESQYKAYSNIAKYNPSLVDKFVMKIADVAPDKPSKGYLGLPNTPTMSSDLALKNTTLDIAGMADAGTTMQGRSIPMSYQPTTLGEKGVSDISMLVSPINKSNNNNQLLEIEQLANESLPRTIDAKIAQGNFDAQSVSAKIDTQLKQSSNFFDVDSANSNMEKALQEARAEKAQTNTAISPELQQSQKQFITGLENDKGYPTKSTPEYLIKQPATSNLNLSDQINIRNPNTFDIAEANDRINSMLNEVPTRGNYDDYRSIMSQSQTTTATKTRYADNQLLNLEKMANEYLPRSSEKLSAKSNTDIDYNNIIFQDKNAITIKTNSSKTQFTNNILPNSFMENPTSPKSKQAEKSRLIANINFDNVLQSTKQQMNTQFTGMDTNTMRLIGNRIMPSNAQEVEMKINEQVAGAKSVVSTGKLNIGIQDFGARNNIWGGKTASATGQGQRSRQLIGVVASGPTTRLRQGQQIKQRITATVSTPTTGVGIGQTIVPITAPTTAPITTSTNTITTSQGQGNFLGNTISPSVLNLPFGGQGGLGNYAPFGGGKKTKARSYEREYPILTGEQLLGF